MRYPDVLSEYDTIRLARTMSLARLGDGELAIARGGKSVSQRADPGLRRELINVLDGRNTAPSLLTCIPNAFAPGPRARYWVKYTGPEYTGLMRAPLYGSCFITRPDNAPWIDTPEYWDAVRDLWRGKSVAYVGGAEVLAKEINRDAHHVHVIPAPKRDAYDMIDELEAFAAASSQTVIIALGAAGTALAARLAKRGIHALDLGHIGQFMTPENQGAYAITEDQLTTPEYRELIRRAHRETNWGRGGYSSAPAIAAFAKELGAVDVLDYGAGGRTLAPALGALGVKCLEYDPGVPEIATTPKLADLVVSTDVFEHIEPELVDNVLRHCYLLARKAGYFAIAKQPAKKVLADGRNAHLTCQPTEWWVERLKAAGWTKLKIVSDEWKKVTIKCRKD